MACKQVASNNVVFYDRLVWFIADFPLFFFFSLLAAFKFTYYSFPLFCSKGTKMVAKMQDKRVHDRFMSMITTGAIYRVTGLSVMDGGEGVHVDYHLKFWMATNLFRTATIFPHLHTAWFLITIFMVPLRSHQFLWFDFFHMNYFTPLYLALAHLSWFPRCFFRCSRLY